MNVFLTLVNGPVKYFLTLVKEPFLYVVYTLVKGPVDVFLTLVKGPF